MTTRTWRGIVARGVTVLAAVCAAVLAAPTGSASAAPAATLQLKSSVTGKVLATTPSSVAPVIVITCYVDDTIPPFRIVNRVAWRSGIQCDAPVVGARYTVGLARDGDDGFFYAQGTVPGPL